MIYINTIVHDSGDPQFGPTTLELGSGAACEKIERRLKFLYPDAQFHLSIVRGNLDVILVVYSGGARRGRVLEAARYYGYADRDPLTKRIFVRPGPMILTKDGPVILANTSRIIVEHVA